MRKVGTRHCRILSRYLPYPEPISVLHSGTSYFCKYIRRAKHFGSKSLAIANKLSAEMLRPCKIEMYPNLIPGLQFHNPVLHKSRNAIASSFKSSSNPDKHNPKSQTNRPFNQRIIEYQNHQLIENID